MTKTEFKRSYFWLLLFAGGLALGTVFANYGMDMSTYIQYSILGDLSNYIKNSTTGSQAVFLHLCLTRIGLFVILGALTFLIRYRIPLYLATAYYGFAFGVVISMLTVTYAAKSIFVLIGMIFPQYLCYIPAFLWLLRFFDDLSKGNYYTAQKRKYYVIGIFVIIAVTFLGCLLESYVNPVWLKFLLKYF